MRITVKLDATLLSEARQVAAKTNRTLAAVIEGALRQHLAQQREREPVESRTVEGNGPLPGVDLDNAASLLELMERDECVL